jgi:soluble lytic murein transglycosylase
MCAPRCASPQRPRALAAGATRHRRDERHRTARPRPGSTGARAPIQATPRPAPTAKRRRAPRAAACRDRAPVHFYGKLAAEELGSRPACRRHRTPLTPAELGAPRQTPACARAAAHRAGPAQRRRARVELHAARHGRSRTARRRPAGLRRRRVGPLHQHQRAHARARSTWRSAFPMPFANRCWPQARAAGWTRPGVRPDPPGVALHQRRALGRRRLGPDAADAGHRTLDGAQARPGLPPDMIKDRDINLRWAPAYLKPGARRLRRLAAMAAAAYNAGPGRPRRWREGRRCSRPRPGPRGIPFNETRDYVKKVLSNATSTTRPCWAGRAPLKARLGSTIGPREGQPSPDTTCPETRTAMKRISCSAAPASSAAPCAAPGRTRRPRAARAVPTRRPRTPPACGRCPR